LDVATPALCWRPVGNVANSLPVWRREVRSRTQFPVLLVGDLTKRENYFLSGTCVHVDLKWVRVHKPGAETNKTAVKLVIDFNYEKISLLRLSTPSVINIQ